jgi:O-antigen/teichoic acid export membrane protein
MAYMNIDQLILTAMRGASETGIYAAGVRLIGLVGILPGIVQSVALPGLVQLHREKRKPEFGSAAYDSLLFLLIPGGLAMALLISLGDWASAILFGRAYASTGGIIGILTAAQFAVFVGTAYASVALALGERKVLLWSALGGMVVNLVLNLWLIPLYGAKAAAWASLISYCVATAGIMVWGPVRAQTRSSAALVVKSAFTVAVSAAVGVLLPGSAATATASLVVLYCLISCCLFPSDVRRVRGWVKGRIERRPVRRSSDGMVG